MALQVQDAILDSDFELADDIAEEHISKFGWQYWNLELSICTLQWLSKGATQPRTKELEKNKDNGLLGFLIRSFANRADPGTNFERFLSIHSNALNFRNKGVSWFSPFLSYKILGKIADPSHAAILLEREWTSSVIDLYELLIELLKNSVSERSISMDRSTCIDAVSRLTKLGIDDYRLEKLLMHISSDTAVASAVDHCVGSIESLTNQFSSDMCPGIDFKLTWSENIQDVLRDVRQVAAHGTSAVQAADRALKWAINHRCLDAGNAVAGAVAFFSSPLTIDSERCLELALASPGLGPWDVMFLFVTADSNAIPTITFTPSDLLFNESSDVIHVLSSCVGLLRSGEPTQTQRLIEALEECNDFQRLCLKLSISNAIYNDSLSSALSSCVTSIANDSSIATELPIAKLIEAPIKALTANRDDTLSAAIISHVSYVLNPTDSIAFKCKLACSKISNILAADITKIRSHFPATNPEILCALLRDVWTEENFAFIPSLKSEEDCAAERLRALAVLRDLDPVNDDAYVDEIKSVTMLQNVRSRLQQLDQTRVYVNEISIARWAERELTSDFTQWHQSLDFSHSIENVAETIQRVVHGQGNDNHEESQPVNGDSSALRLLDFMNLVHDRFLSAPGDGLDSYLSLRVRHGSLEGVILSPVLSLNIAKCVSHESVLENFRTITTIDIDSVQTDEIMEVVDCWSTLLSALKDKIAFVNSEKIQVRTTEKPLGEIRSRPPLPKRSSFDRITRGQRSGVELSD